MNEWEAKRFARKARQEETQRLHRITRMKVAAVVLSVLAFAAMGFSVLPTQKPEVQQQEICIKAGDTLWDIASEHPIDSMTTAEVVDYIKKANGLDSCTIQPGTTLRVPDTTT